MVAVFILADYLHASHEAPFAALGGKSLALSLKISVELWQFLPEIIYADLKIHIGQEEITLHNSLFYAIASLTSEDDELAHHIHA